ncbi:MAG: Transcriptional repressor SdpR [Planctomycetota bacterium]|jgi:DNA-binding transcriptional ArsR family regulator
MVENDAAASDTDDFAQCATYLKALADPIRLRLVRALQHGPMTVSDLAELLETELANISHHLRVLFHADLVTIRKDGKFSYYELNREFIANQAVAKTLHLGCCKIDLRA